MLTFITSIWGKIAGAALLLAGFIAWLMLRDARMMKKGADKLVSKQMKEHVDAIQKGREAESDVGSGSDRDKRLSDEFRRD